MALKCGETVGRGESCNGAYACCSKMVVTSQARDVEEGADMLMVKPGMAYLDIVRDIKEKVSGNHHSNIVEGNFWMLVFFSFPRSFPTTP